MKNEPPQGQRFSHVYLDRGRPTQDSVRMRVRIASQILDIKLLTERLAAEILREIGISFPYGGSWLGFVKEVALRDLLDLITLAFRILEADPYAYMQAGRWVQNIQRIFEEENVCYRLDPKGGVHFHVDEESARNSASAIAALQSARYANALHAFDGAMAELRHVPPSGKGAIRGIFGAAEAIFKLILPKVPRLGAAELDGLVPLLQHAQDDTARRSAAKMLSSLKDRCCTFLSARAGNTRRSGAAPAGLGGLYREHRCIARPMARGA
jgi:hypothetical protein